MDIKDNECKLKEAVRKFPLPEFVSCFQHNTNSIFLDTPERKAWMNWIWEYCLMTQEMFNRIQGLGAFVDLGFSLCDDLKRYEIIHKYIVSSFVSDDQCELESAAQDSQNPDPNSLTIPQQYQQMIDKLEDNSISMIRWKPYIMAQFATIETIYQSYNQIQKRRFIDAWNYYIQGLRDERKYQKNGKNSNSIDDLIEFRNKSVAFRTGVQVYEYTNNLFITEELWESSDWQSLLDMSAKHCSLVNDIYSFEREFEQAQNDLTKMNNFIAFKVIVENFTIKESMDQAIEIIKFIEKQILDIEDKILMNEDCDSDVKVFIKCLNYSLGGNYYASTHLDRYTKL